MLRYALTVLVTSIAVSGHAADRPIERFVPQGQTAAAAIDHAPFDALLQRHVVPDGEGLNRVDYEGLGKERAALDAYLAAMEAAAPSRMGADAAHAYWINLYNAKTLDVVLDAYPVDSIRRINLGGGLFAIGPWKKDVLTVEGEALSLDDVEHRIVRAIFKDPMSHYGLNCASYSCPNLMTRAYTAENLHALLEASARDYVNHPRGVRVANGRIRASRIYRWYADDFGGEDELKAHWARFLLPDKAAAVEGAAIAGYDYDWRLNDVE